MSKNNVLNDFSNDQEQHFTVEMSKNNVLNDFSNDQEQHFTVEMSKNNVLNDFTNDQEHFEINKQDLNAKIKVVNKWSPCGHYMVTTWSTWKWSKSNEFFKDHSVIPCK
jgi:hypothetical protein